VSFFDQIYDFWLIAEATYGYLQDDVVNRKQQPTQALERQVLGWKSLCSIPA
jgi:hypothetical protein